MNQLLIGECLHAGGHLLKNDQLDRIGNGLFIIQHVKHYVMEVTSRCKLNNDNGVVCWCWGVPELVPDLTQTKITSEFFFRVINLVLST